MMSSPTTERPRVQRGDLMVSAMLAHERVGARGSLYEVVGFQTGQPAPGTPAREQVELQNALTLATSWWAINEVVGVFRLVRAATPMPEVVLPKLTA
jgi:hypothetical protein